MSLKVSRILHAGYLFECGETTIAFDPIFENPFSRNCYAYPPVKFDIEKIKSLKLSAVFISHYHDDHCSMESLNLLDRATPIYIYCLFDEMIDLIKSLGFIEVHSLKLNKPIVLGDISITPKRALDAEVDSIFHIQASGFNILNVVDSWIDDETLEQLAKYAPWDMVLWPFQTMREIEVISPQRAETADLEIPSEWAQQLQTLNPKYIVPSSCQFLQEPWSWYNEAFFPISYENFNQQMKTVIPRAKVIKLNPGISTELTQSGLKNLTRLDWIIPIGEQDVDYHYKPNLIPPTTSEVSKNFTALSAEQALRVLNYCKIEMLQKLKALPAAQSDYFAKSCNWQLSVYDYSGEAQLLYYKILENQIELLTEAPPIIHWRTEAALAKIYAALEYGESLTSMYVRINEGEFSPELKKKISEVDITEDPLIRSLFNGAFGHYQKAQLKKLIT